MFSAAPNAYDELVGKATDENLSSEDWALNLEVCDKVTGEGQNGARQAVGALQKRLAHRNPNVQIYALELANTLAQNCGKPLLEELSSRNWTQGLDRLINDRTTNPAVKKKALGYVKAWARQFEDTGDPNLGMMGELYDQLRGKNFNFDEPEAPPESTDDARRRREEEELARVLELSKQDKGGRYQPSQPTPSAAAGSGSSSRPYQPSQPERQVYQPPPPPEPQAEPLDLNTATRVRALYTFTSNELGELNFERGDVIKVLDRGFKEWWRGACNGKIGIFPVTYVEAVPEPSARELQEEAQEEARVFASLGLVDQLLQTLKGIDPSRGERLDDHPEIEEMYQSSVGLQGQITALIKKYSDQKAELEHMNANFLRAMRQYEELRAPAAVPQYGYAPPHDPYAQQQQYAQQPQQPSPHQQYAQQPSQPQYPQAQPYAAPPQAQQYPQHSSSGDSYGPHDYATPQSQAAVQYGQQPAQAFPNPNPVPSPQAPGEAAPGQYYRGPSPSGHAPPGAHAPNGAPEYPPSAVPERQNTAPGAAGIGATQDEHAAAWEAYYRQQAEAQGQQPAVGAQPYPAVATGQYDAQAAQPQQQPYGASPYAPAGSGQRIPSYAGSVGSVDGVTGGMNRMSVHGQ